MCGISGIISNNSSNEELYENINSMRLNLSHRGPDDYGIWIDSEKGISIAHNRLSIIDLSEKGHQPMKSRNGRFIISFNGEIYNYQELKNFINNNFPKKISWYGNSDTEVLLQAIELIGLRKTLKLITGMFAFALWDKSDNELYLVRDRFGEKPLYWGFLNKKNNEVDLVFGSELSAIKNLKSFNNKICKKALNQYFNYGYISAPNCIYEELYQLPPSHFVKIEYKKLKENPHYKPNPQCWYEFINKKEANYSNTKESINELEVLLTKSISLQNNADVPLCTFLSGGIDSTLVATLLQKSTSKKINTLTISFPEFDKKKELFNEGPFASKIAKHIGSNHYDIPITAKDALKIIPSLSKVYSEPFSDSSQIATFLLCNATNNAGFKVALTGDGADELFGGYNRHIFLPKIYSFISKKPNNIKKILSFLLKKIPIQDEGLFKDKRQKLIKAINNSDSLDEMYEGIINLSISEKILCKSLKIDTKKIMNNMPKENMAEMIMLQDLINYLPSDILVKTDRASMANSIETRAPFLDHKIVEFSRGISLSRKFSRNPFSRTGKIILQEILSKYLPREMFVRPKAGFAVPIGSWLKGPLKEWADHLLSEDMINKGGYINYEEINYIWKNHLNNKYDYTPQLWCILMWQSWISYQ